MRLSVLLSIAFVLVCATPRLLPGQDGSTRFKASTLVVTLDAVVLDRNGERVRCLQASDFEVLEGRQRQAVHSIELVGPHDCASETAAPSQEDKPPDAAAVLGLSAPPPMTAIVFEELGPEARALVLRAVNGYVDEMRHPDEFVGIFAVDRAVHTLQKYTRDRERLLQGAKKAAMRPGCPIVLEGDIAPAGHPSPCPGGDVRSIATLRGLRNIVDALANLPGRKTVLLFSEGFEVRLDTNAIDIFRNLIARANQAEITFQSIDAAGLRVSHSSAGTRRRLSSYTGPTDQNGLLSNTQDAHDLLSNDITAPLESLARDTGGRFIFNTNDIDSGLRHVADDQTQYYRLTYHPANQKLDGQYREISVRTTIPGAVVFSRRGYIASADPPEYAAQAHEMSPLLMVESGETDETLTVDVKVDKTRSPASVQALVPAATLTFKPEDGADDLTAGLTLIVRTLNREGLTLALTSRTFAINARPGEIGRARQKTISFETTIDWRKDAKTLEVIAYDVAGRRVGIQRVR